MRIFKDVFLCGVLFFAVHIHAMQPKKVSFSDALTRSQADLIKREIAIFEAKRPVWYELDFEVKLLMIGNKKIDKAHRLYVNESTTVTEFNAVVDSQVRQEIK